MTVKGSSDTFSFGNYTVMDNTVLLYYGCGVHRFEETISFSAPLDTDDQRINNAICLLHLVCGVSYYKAFVQDVRQFTTTYPLTLEMADFLNSLYEQGLGELLYRHKLSPILPAKFIGDKSVFANPVSLENSDGFICGLGGGKDSLVAVELLKRVGGIKIKSFGVNATDILKDQAEILDIEFYPVKRVVDTNSLANLVAEGGNIVPNGHIPISAILMTIGLIESLLTGSQYLVSGVERSASEPSVRNYQGKSINHQYSKSYDFETRFNKVIKSEVTQDVEFFSVLRPLTELDIMKIFLKLKLNEKFAKKYTSCNRALAFTSGNDGSANWCGECQKCAFIFLLFCGADGYDEAIKLFGHDLIGGQTHKETYLQLLGLSGRKPFECVGEINECRFAMKQARIYSEYAKNFSFEDPLPIEIWNNEHSIPTGLSARLKQKVTSILQ